MNREVIKRAIIVSWVLLVVCLIIKVLGGDVLNAVVANQRILDFCNLLDSNYTVQSLVYYPLFLLSNGLTILAITQKKWFGRNEFALVLTVLTLCYTALVFLPSLNIVSSVIVMVILPLIIIGKNYKRYLNILLGVVLIIAFQVISMITADLMLTSVVQNSLTGLILMIDTYIMLVLFYLYSSYYYRGDK